MGSSQEFKDFMRKLNESGNRTPPPPSVAEAQQQQQTSRKALYASSKELHVKDLVVAYVRKNSDGSFTQLKIHKTKVEAAWTTIIAETTKNTNQITDMRMAPLEKWENPAPHGKRVIYAEAEPVQPQEDLGQFIRNRTIRNPVLLVCWENAPSSCSAVVEQQQQPTTKHINHKKKNCKRRQWYYCLFTGGVDITKPKGGPVILAHTEVGTSQLDEDGINCIASSAFIDWITHKVNTEGWEVISLTNLSASVRVRLCNCCD